MNTSWSYLPNGFLVGKGGFSRYREKISAVRPVSGEATVMWMNEVVPRKFTPSVRNRTEGFYFCKGELVMTVFEEFKRRG